MTRLSSLQLIIALITITSCNTKQPKKLEEIQQPKAQQYIVVLGTAQDAGYPQINCDKDCCKVYYEGTQPKKLISSLGLVNTQTNKKYLFDATPDITQQLQNLKTNNLDNGSIIDGVFLTHAHIGHYTGLMFLGHEAMGAKSIPVYAMPKMKHYLETNGPWSQLVNFKNIQLQNLQNDSVVSLDNQLKVTPFTVPHRDEYSETVGYKIEGRKKSALFIPDINKWHLWDKDIVEEVKKVDYAFLDATFYKDGEIPRPMSEVQHPFIEETIALFANETKAIKQKIVFIHFNHSNPTLHKNNASRKELEALGFGFATEGEVYPL
jgi:pyrroloquinoline quinone biosynthesis protein B